MAIPIVFIHKGNSDYLPYTFLQARVTNPHSRLVLIGNPGNKLYRGLVEHHDYRQYFEMATQLAQVYVHESTLGYDYELFCLQRWMILLEFMTKQGLDEILYLDSDILSYCNFSNEAKTLPPHAEMTITGISGHTNFIRGTAGLKDFCRYIMNGYTGPMAQMVRSLWLQAHYAKDGVNGGISDMTFLYHYFQEFGHRMADLSKEWDGKMCDVSLEYHQGLQKEGKIKRIEYRGQQPYGFREADGEPVRMLTLHFQGFNKPYLYTSTTGWGPAQHRALRRYRLQGLVQKVFNKIFGKA